MSRQITSRHGRLAYDRSGAGDPVVLLHGIPGSRASWSLVSSLLEEHADVVVPDLLGFGESARPSDPDVLHAEGQAQALLDLLDAIGLDRVTLVGHDFGGPVAVQILRQAPDRVAGLGLLATNAFVDTPIPLPLSLVTWPVVGGLMARLLMSEASLRMMLRTGAGQDAPPLDPAVYVGDAGQRRSIRRIFEASLRELGRLYAPVEETLRSASVAGFVAWGDRDPFFTVDQGRRTAAAYGAPFVLLPDAGHFLPAERPEEIAAEVLRLVRVTPEAAAPR